ncbi:hypothetical protein RE428_15650 [Marinobacter nanhaiticus D15-8W]|nr:hypothetical protein RE428_15650 [Marinobacter nanhaiticus D15-8W]
MGTFGAGLPIPGMLSVIRIPAKVRWTYSFQFGQANNDQLAVEMGSRGIPA